MIEIAKESAALAEKARKGHLEADDVKEGTITLTNFGMTGIRMGFPIIRYPECAIIGLGAIKKEPTIMDDETVAARSVAMMTLTFDHRLLDGLYGCGFASKVKEILENPYLFF